MVDKSPSDRFDQFLHKASYTFYYKIRSAPARKNTLAQAQLSLCAIPNGKDAFGQQ
jgi:hypothetical protein